jgi:predicted dehydrogenase
MPDPLRCAVVGAGTMGSLYAAAFAQLPDAELTKIVDLDEERAAAVAAEHPGSETLSSVEALLDGADVDAVAVALPDFAHRETVNSLLEAGMHVLCEKPLATTREDCQAMAAAERASSAFLMVNYGNRHKPAARVLRERIRGGELGAVQSIIFKGHEQLTKTLTLKWRDRTSPTWFLISHIVDMVEWLTGEKLVSVFGLGAPGSPEILGATGGPNTVTYLGELEGGGHATMSSSWILPKGFTRGGDFSVEVIGESGVATVDFTELGARYYGTTASEPGWDFDTPDFDGKLSGWWFTSCRYFVDCARSGRRPEPDALEGLRVSSVLAAMTESIETGARVEVPDWTSGVADA